MFNVILFTDAPYPHHKIRGYGVHRIASQIRANGYTCLVVDFSSALTFARYKEIIDNSVGPETLMVGFSTTWMPYRWPELPGEYTNQIPGHYIGEEHEVSHLKQEQLDWRSENLIVNSAQFQSLLDIQKIFDIFSKYHHMDPKFPGNGNF